MAFRAERQFFRGVDDVDAGTTGGVGRPDLAVNSETLDPVATTARELYDDLDRYGCAAEDDVSAASGDFRQVGMATGPTLAALAEWWRRQRDDLLADCSRISGHLDDTVRSHDGLESDVQVSLHGIAGGLVGGAVPPEVGPNLALLRSAGIDDDGHG